MKETSSRTTPETTRAQRRKARRRRLLIRRIAVITVAVLLLAALVWGVIEITKASKGQTTTFLGVKAIEVTCADEGGSVRYTDEEIIRASGLFLDQSLLALNKVQASEKVLAQFPYLDYVEVKNTSFSTVCIRVSEAEVLAAVSATDAWLIVGDNNHVLESVAADKIPVGTLKVLGVTPLAESLRADALDERSLRVTETLVSAIKANALDQITAVDMTEKTNLRLWWDDRLEIILGNESNLAVQVAAFKKLLPTLLAKNGNDIAGQLDMSTYADDNPDNDRAVFTPADALKKPTTDKTDGDTAADSTTDTTAAGGSTASATAGA